MYREAQAKSKSSGDTSPGDGGQPGGDKSDVVDAEFKDLGENKK
jgi:hypothetical protein